MVFEGVYSNIQQYKSINVLSDRGFECGWKSTAHKTINRWRNTMAVCAQVSEYHYHPDSIRRAKLYKKNCRILYKRPKNNKVRNSLLLWRCLIVIKRDCLCQQDVCVLKKSANQRCVIYVVFQLCKTFVSHSEHKRVTKILYKDAITCGADVIKVVTRSTLSTIIISSNAYGELADSLKWLITLNF